jgi:hypothetical protein
LILLACFIMPAQPWCVSPISYKTRYELHDIWRHPTFILSNSLPLKTQACYPRELVTREQQWHNLVQNTEMFGPGTHPAPYPVGTGGSFLGVKQSGREANHSPPSSAEVKNECSYTSTPQYVVMAWCLVMYRDNFTFTLKCWTATFLYGLGLFLPQNSHSSLPLIFLNIHSVL